MRFKLRSYVTALPNLRTKTEGNFNTREAAEARLKELEEKVKESV